ncbi:MAG: peptidoglycan DD-metalloendopeptidase family protein [Acidobacteriota bacterium]
MHLDDSVRSRAAAVRRWLESMRGACFPILEGDLTIAPVIDLTAGSADLEGAADPGDQGALSRRIEDRLKAAGATVALGRHDEARAMYSMEPFTGPAPRCLHLGVDLFADPGTPVRAPFDGTVHSFADHAGDWDYGPTIVLRHAVPDSEVVFFSLWGHLDRGSLDGPFEALVVRRGDTVGRLGTREVNGGWAPHLHFQLMVDLRGHYATFPGVVPPAEREAWLELCPDPSPVLDLPRDRVVAGV